MFLYYINYIPWSITKFRFLPSLPENISKTFVLRIGRVIHYTLYLGVSLCVSYDIISNITLLLKQWKNADPNSIYFESTPHRLFRSFSNVKLSVGMLNRINPRIESKCVSTLISNFLITPRSIYNLDLASSRKTTFYSIKRKREKMNRVVKLSVRLSAAKVSPVVSVINKRLVLYFSRK